MATALANGVHLYYEVQGDGAPLLGIHGTPSSALLWVDAARRLAEIGRCIIYDRRGFGRSERPPPFEAVDLADHVNDARALLETLSAIPAVVIGRSTGGQVALELAHRHPDAVRALVLLEAAVFTADPQANAWAADLRRGVLRVADDDPAAAAETVIRQALGDPTWQSLPADVRALMSAASPAVLAEIRGKGLDLSDDPLVLHADELATIAQPTLIVSAENSPEACRRVGDRLAENLPNTESVRVTGGHVIDPAHPSVLAFIARVLDGPG